MVIEIFYNPFKRVKQSLGDNILPESYKISTNNIEIFLFSNI